MLTDGTNVFPVAIHLPDPVRFHIAFPSAVGISAIKTRAAGACAGVDAGVGIVGGAVLLRSRLLAMSRLRLLLVVLVLVPIVPVVVPMLMLLLVVVWVPPLLVLLVARS